LDRGERKTNKWYRNRRAPHINNERKEWFFSGTTKKRSERRERREKETVVLVQSPFPNKERGPQPSIKLIPFLISTTVSFSSSADIVVEIRKRRLRAC